MERFFTLRLIPACLALAFAGTAGASGFQLQNQNGAGTGLAYAGAAAVAEDASTIFFNPAGMTYLPQGHSLSLGGTVIDRSVKFTDTGTTPMPVINPLTGAPTGAFHPIGDNGGNGGGTTLVPAFYYSYAVTPELRAGLGLSATYGSETDYDSNFAGRFSGLHTSIRQINLNPSVAWKASEVVSLGFGLDLARTHVEFRQNAPYIGAPLGILQGDDTGWGWNAGAMFQLTPATRLGVSYRSTIKFDLSGRQTVAAPLNIDRPITAALKTPDTFSLALNQRLGERTDLLADLTWTGWSSVQALAPMAGAAPATAPLRYNFRDTWRVGLGAKYQLNPDWNLRAGLAFDQTPVPDAASRTMTVPDANRTWLSFGARWKMSPQTTVDMGYAHIFFKDATTARAVKNTSETVTLQTVNGTIKTSANLFSLQLNYNF